MRRGSRHERGWTGWFECGGARTGSERRAAWDLRCLEAVCPRVHGRRSPHWRPRGHRSRGSGGRFRAGGRLF